jgi:hypothetical protein
MNDATGTAHTWRLLALWIGFDLVIVLAGLLYYFNFVSWLNFVSDDTVFCLALLLLHIQVFLALFWIFVGPGRYLTMLEHIDWPITLGIVFVIGCCLVLPLCCAGTIATGFAIVPVLYLRLNQFYLIPVPKHLYNSQQNQFSLRWLFGFTTFVAIGLGLMRTLAFIDFYDEFLFFGYVTLLWSIVPLLLILGMLRPFLTYHFLPCITLVAGIMALPLFFPADSQANAWMMTRYNLVFTGVMALHFFYWRMCGLRLISYA